MDDRLGQPEVLTDPLPTLLELQQFSAAVLERGVGRLGTDALRRRDRGARGPATYSSEQRFTTLLDRLPASIQPRIARLRRHYSYGLIQSDPPTHTRLRLMVRDAFIPRTMAAFRPNVASLADELIDGFVERGSADLMAEFAYVLPISVMCALLAVPVEDREQFIDWDVAISGIQSTGASRRRARARGQRRDRRHRRLLPGAGATAQERNRAAT